MSDGRELPAMRTIYKADAEHYTGGGIDVGYAALELHLLLLAAHQGLSFEPLPDFSHLQEVEGLSASCNSPWVLTADLTQALASG